MTFVSILFEREKPEPPLSPTDVPAPFADLHLDEIVQSATADWKEYDLAPFFGLPLRSLAEITYRQEVFHDLEDPILIAEIKAFSKHMQSMRERLDQVKKLGDFHHAAQRCFLAAAEHYSTAVERLAQWLAALDLRSRGLRTFRVYLTEYLRSDSFRRVVTQTHTLGASLSAIRYSLLLRDGGVTVQHCDTDRDYSATIEDIFRKFRQDGPQDYWVELRKWSGMNHIEAQIQQRVALLYPDTFRALEAFSVQHADFVDASIARFDREIHFYLAYLAYIERLRHAGLNFCLPQLSGTSKEARVREAFDLALATKLLQERSRIVPNDFHLSGAERILVVTGPNHGGKTTFARMFGQLHYFAYLGCPVPGKEARLFLFDQLFTHFEREEHITSLRGKLQDDLLRIHEILQRATPDSLLVLNEVFSSTTLADAVGLSRKIMTAISELDLVAVWVTFLDELASFNHKTVSMVATVDPQDHATRTFRLERRPADGLAYALAIAEKHRVTYASLKERLDL